MPKSLMLAGVALTAAVTVLAQQNTDRVSFSGSVVNTATGAPVPFARVAISPGGNETLTDISGTFRFPDVAVGNYFVRASKTGFATPDDSETTNSVSLTAALEKCTVGLTPLSSIRGQITEADGEPVESATVLAVKSAVVEGHRQLKVMAAGTTNDRGEYRISMLPAGEYLVQVSGQSSQEHYYGDAAPRPAVPEGFPPVYFGGSPTASGASPVLLQPGIESHADFRVILRPGYRIRGVIPNLRPHSSAELQLSKGDEDRGATRSSLELATGKFEISGALDGAHRLRVYQRNDEGQLLLAEQEVVLRGGDVDGLVLPLGPAPPLKGKVRTEGELNPTQSTHSLLSVALYPEDSFLPEGIDSGPRGSNELVGDTFEIPAVFPGKYWIQFEASPQTYVVSARAGGRDVLADQELVIGPGAPPELDVVLRTDGGSVRGSIEARIGKSEFVEVLLVPESCDRPVSSRGATAESGFTFWGVAPGNYRLHVVKERAAVEFGSPAVRNALAASGTPVVVKTGQTTEVPVQKISEGLK